MSRTTDHSVWFDPKTGNIRLAVPYNGDRHNELRQSFTIGKNGQKITLTQFEDGEIESIEIVGYPGAGLDLDVWGRMP